MNRFTDSCVRCFSKRDFKIREFVLMGIVRQLQMKDSCSIKVYGLCSTAKQLSDTDVFLKSSHHVK